MSERYTYSSPDKLVGQMTAIEFGENDNHFTAAFSSPEFGKRLQAGLSRVDVHGAESGFMIFGSLPHEGKNVYVSPLVLGMQDTDVDINLIQMLGVRPAQVDVGLAIPKEFIETKRLSIATIHWHPDATPFSDPDLEIVDDLVKKNKNGIAHNSLEVVVIPHMARRRQSAPGSPITSVTFFGIQPKHNHGNRYQAGLPQSITAQTEVLRNDGFHVWQVELPVVKGKLQNIGKIAEAFVLNPPDTIV